MAAKGQSLIELILAVAIASIFLAAIATGVIAVREGFARSGKSLEATLLLQKEVEVVRSIKETAWNSISSAGTYHVEQSGNGWIAVAGTVSGNGFTRSFKVETVCRTANTSPPVNCTDPQAKTDPSTKKVTAAVSWSFLGTYSVSSPFYITRYFGNKTWVQTTVADFNAGTRTNTVVTNNSGGEVEFSPSGATSEFGNRFLVTDTSGIGDLTSNTRKTSLCFTAQSSKTVSAIRVYLQTEAGTSPNYRYGIQADARGLPSGTYLGSGTLTATTTGWQTITISPSVNLTTGTIYHIVVQWNSGTVNNKNYIALRQSSPLNALNPYSNVPDAWANTLFNNGTTWTIQGFQPIYELDFTGTPATYEGNPYESSTEVAIFGSNFIGERFRFTNTSKIAIGISFYVRKQSNPPNSLDIVLQDIGTGQLSTCSIPASQVSNTYSYQGCIFTPSVALNQNSNYRVYLKTTGGASNKSYRIYHIDTTDSFNYNSISYDGINSVYTSSINSGSSWTDTNYWDIGGFYFTVQTPGLATSGTFESQIFNAGSTAGFNFITMTVNEPVNTNIRLQVATNNDGLTWNFAGPNGTASSYFDNPGAIHLDQISGQYFRFKAFFESDGTATPVLFDLTTNYSP